MKIIYRLIAFMLALFLTVSLASLVGAQVTTSATATATTPSVGTPNTMSIKEHFLAQQQARIQGEIREVKRCIANASNTQVVRDPEGNLNRVPQIDLTDCTRRLQQLTRQLEILARRAAALTQDANVASMRAETLARNAARQKRMQLPSSQSSGGM